VQQQRDVSVRIVSSAAVALALLGCGSASFDAFGGAPTTTNEDAVASGDDVALPDSPITIDSGTMNGDTGPAPLGCGRAGDAGMSNVCVHVTKGAEGPPITAAETANLGIDGNGTLLIALATTPPRKASDLVAVTTLPTVSSGAKFGILDLPKVAELSVPPGKYYVVALFRDAPPYDRSDLMVGDWTPGIIAAKDLPQVDLSDPTVGVAIELPLFPVRGFDTTLRLDASVKPLGSGMGPVRAQMIAPSGRLVGQGTLPCASVAAGTTATVRVLTTAAPGPFSLQGALFDFATGPDDPSLEAATLPPGTLATTGGTADSLESGWLGAPRSLVLNRVVPFGGVVATDPTSACYGFAIKQ
jgi:hypothetical protein